MAITKLSDSSITTGDKYISMLAGNAPFSLSSYESIATVTVGSGGSATIDFTSIPATYTHLQVRGIARTNLAAVAGAVTMIFNSDSGSNYVRHRLVGDGSTVISAANTAQIGIGLGQFPGSSAGANIFGTMVLDILDYKDTNKYTTARNITGQDQNGSGDVRLNSNLWLNTSAITSISIVPAGGASFVQYTEFYLFGIKGA